MYVYGSMLEMKYVLNCVSGVPCII